MKFGHNLPRNQVPEWAPSYINYKGLKKLIKIAAEATKNGLDLDLAGLYSFYQTLSAIHILFLAGDWSYMLKWC